MILIVSEYIAALKRSCFLFLTPSDRSQPMYTGKTLVYHKTIPEEDNNPINIPLCIMSRLSLHQPGVIDLLYLHIVQSALLVTIKLQ